VSDRLKDKVAIITGAGSRGPGLGNGKAAAILFAREGARVLCVDAKLENAEETAKMIAHEGGEAAVFAANVTRQADCEAMVKAALDRWDAQAGAKPMVERGRGAIICVSSVAALRGHGRTAYAAAKAGVIDLVRTCAAQLGPKGVRVNAIAPGLVWTPMVESVGPELREKRRKASPLGTEGEGWDVGWAAVYLASEEARW